MSVLGQPAGWARVQETQSSTEEKGAGSSSSPSPQLLDVPPFHHQAQQKREAEDREREKRIQEERKNAGPSAKELETRRLTESLLTKGLGIVQACLFCIALRPTLTVGLLSPWTGGAGRRLPLQRCRRSDPTVYQLWRSSLHCRPAEGASLLGGEMTERNLPQSLPAAQMAAEYILAHPDDFLPFLSTEEELPQGGLENYCDQVRLSLFDSIPLSSRGCSLLCSSAG